jgi:hypothetical protein
MMASFLKPSIGSLTQSLPTEMAMLPSDFVPGERDVICQRGKSIYLIVLLWTTFLLAFVRS